ncbi:efflux RND transporter permease subunit [Aureibacillus halotolerans]|uniref:Multidrug efflux pump subunit AcrB n=1 Tax=Aureibacillus halotolerans TaxID=1508390 RepID=A0A4R6TSG4_9BACI|nr:efflux RND transporter permease subunit [Aureibacillus halotolerans]TDQ36560.1 multidrug efflux pump subunit AcrB [Aureibacillus halotolerans]
MIEYFIRKKKITLLFFTMAMVLGIFTFTQIPHQEMPDAEVNQAIVTTPYPGADPKEIEQTVTKVIESRIKEIQDLDFITSTSSNGISQIIVKTEDDADVAKKWDELRKKVDDAKPDLPEDAMAPIINDDLAKSFVESLAITADTKEGLLQLNNLMLQWRDEIRTVDGVSGVDITGLPEKEVRIAIDTELLKQYGIPWEQVLQSIQKTNDRLPTGSITYDSRDYQLIVPSIEDMDAYTNTYIASTQEGTPIYLRDIGTASVSTEEPEYAAYVNGKPAISINISSETGSDVPTIASRVDAKMAELEKTLPTYATLNSLFAQEDNVNHIFADLTKEMIIAIAAVILICTLGLNLLTSAFVALSIPISIGLAAIFLPMLGVTLNQISVVGLIIVLGILVDDAVVVNDNIERRLSTLGESPKDAARKGTKEVAVSILTATVATIAAFAPLLFLTGNIGAFIKPIPIVISLTMIASMVMSLTIIPIFREWYEGKRAHKKRKQGPPGLLGKQIEALSTYYSRRIVPKLLKKPLLTALSGLIIGTLAYGLIFFTPIELFPQAEDPQATIDVALPVGTSFTKTTDQVEEMTTWLSEQPETASYSYAIGGAAPQLFSDISGGEAGSTANTAQIAVSGKEGSFDVTTTVLKWQDALDQKYPGAKISIRVPRLGIPVGSPVSIRLLGEDISQLQQVADQVKTIVSETPGTIDIEDTMGIENYALQVDVDEHAMAAYNVTYNDLTRSLLLLDQGLPIGDYNTGQELIDIQLYAQKSENESPLQLFENLSVTSATGEQIPISQFASLVPSFSLDQIHHYNLERSLTVEADVQGRTATEVMADVEQKLETLELPNGVTWEIGGETNEQEKIFSDLASLGIVVGFLIIIVITMQFYSLTTPLVIMTTVYLAGAGGIIGIFLTGSPVGFMSIMGVIALSGIVVRNGIVMIEFIKDAREEGVPLLDAIIESADARFRPILLTSLTAIVGLLPIATIGSILFRPMALTIIFGLLFSTVLTLIVVPCLYMVVERWKMKRKNKKRKTTAHTDDSFTM